MKLLLGVSLFVFLVAVCHAAPQLIVRSQDGVVITLYDEPCNLPAVSNMPMRATWTKGTEKYEGCWQVFSGQVVALYFDDKSVAVVPAQHFSRIVPISFRPGDHLRLYLEHVK